MNTFRLLVCVAVLGLASAAGAQQQQRPIQCKDAHGRLTMSDRACDAPTVGQPTDRPVTERSLDRVDAPDIFRARAKMREGDTAMPQPAPGRSVDPRSTQTY